MHARTALCSLSLVLVLLVPWAGWASEAESKPEFLEPPKRAEPERPHVPRGLRLLAETAVGGGAAAGLGVAGFYLAGYSCEKSRGGFSCLNDASLGAVLGVGLGFPLGVWGTGDLLGGNGSLLASYVGMAGGMLLGFGLASAGCGDSDLGAAGPLACGAGLVLPFASTLVAYELSTRPPAAAAPVATRPRLQPLLGFSSRGALMGVGGLF